MTSEFYIDKNDIDKWIYLKGTKKEMRTNAQGFEYNYSEGGMILKLGVPLSGRAFRSNLFPSLKKGFSLQFLTQKHHKWILSKK